MSDMIPLVASADDLPAAIRYAQTRTNARWYVTQRARALGEADQIPADWGMPAVAASGAGDLSEDARDQAADEGEALPDGSFPIRNIDELTKAVHALGRAKDPDRAKRHIIKRARALDALDKLPDTWGITASAAELIAEDTDATVELEALIAASVHGEGEHLAHGLGAAWDESLHPRGRDGKWITRGGSIDIYNMSGERKPALRAVAEGVHHDPKLGTIVTAKVTAPGMFQGAEHKAGDTIQVLPQNIEQAPDARAHLTGTDSAHADTLNAFRTDPENTSHMPHVPPDYSGSGVAPGMAKAMHNVAAGNVVSGVGEQGRKYLVHTTGSDERGQYAVLHPEGGGDPLRMSVGEHPPQFVKYHGSAGSNGEGNYLHRDFEPGGDRAARLAGRDDATAAVQQHYGDDRQAADSPFKPGDRVLDQHGYAGRVTGPGYEAQDGAAHSVQWDNPAVARNYPPTALASNLRPHPDGNSLTPHLDNLNSYEAHPDDRPGTPSSTAHQIATKPSVPLNGSKYRASDAVKATDEFALGKGAAAAAGKAYRANAPEVGTGAVDHSIDDNKFDGSGHRILTVNHDLGGKLGVTNGEGVHRFKLGTDAGGNPAYAHLESKGLSMGAPTTALDDALPHGRAAIEDHLQKQGFRRADSPDQVRSPNEATPTPSALDVQVAEWNAALESGDPERIARARKQTLADVHSRIMADDPNYQTAGYRSLPQSAQPRDTADHVVVDTHDGDNPAYKSPDYDRAAARGYQLNKDHAADASSVEPQEAGGDSATSLLTEADDPDTFLADRQGVDQVDNAGMMSGVAAEFEQAGDHPDTTPEQRAQLADKLEGLADREAESFSHFDGESLGLSEEETAQAEQKQQQAQAKAARVIAKLRGGDTPVDTPTPPSDNSPSGDSHTFKQTGDPVTTQKDYANHILDEAYGYQDSNREEGDTDPDLDHQIQEILDAPDDQTGADRAQELQRWLTANGYADPEDFQPRPGNGGSTAPPNGGGPADDTAEPSKDQALHDPHMQEALKRAIDSENYSQAADLAERMGLDEEGVQAFYETATGGDVSPEEARYQAAHQAVKDAEARGDHLSDDPRDVAAHNRLLAIREKAFEQTPAGKQQAADQATAQQAAYERDLPGQLDASRRANAVQADRRAEHQAADAATAPDDRIARMSDAGLHMIAGTKSAHAPAAEAELDRRGSTPTLVQSDVHGDGRTDRYRLPSGHEVQVDRHTGRVDTADLYRQDADGRDALDANPDAFEAHYTGPSVTHDDHRTLRGHQPAATHSDVETREAALRERVRPMASPGNLHTDRQGNGIREGDRVTLHRPTGDQSATVTGTHDGGGVMDITPGRKSGIVDYRTDAGSTGSTLSGQVTTHGQASSAEAVHNDVAPQKAALRDRAKPRYQTREDRGPNGEVQHHVVDTQTGHGIVRTFKGKPNAAKHANDLNRAESITSHREAGQASGMNTKTGPELDRIIHDPNAPEADRTAANREANARALYGSDLPGPDAAPPSAVEPRKAALRAKAEARVRSLPPDDRLSGVHSETHKGEQLSVQRHSGKPGYLQGAINGHVVDQPVGFTNKDAVDTLDRLRGTVDDAHERPHAYTNGLGAPNYDMKLNQVPAATEARDQRLRDQGQANWNNHVGRQERAETARRKAKGLDEHGNATRPISTSIASNQLRVAGHRSARDQGAGGFKVTRDGEHVSVTHTGTADERRAAAKSTVDHFTKLGYDVHDHGNGNLTIRNRSNVAPVAAPQPGPHGPQADRAAAALDTGAPSASVGDLTDSQRVNRLVEMHGSDRSKWSATNLRLAAEAGDQQAKDELESRGPKA